MLLGLYAVMGYKVKTFTEQSIADEWYIDVKSATNWKWESVIRFSDSIVFYFPKMPRTFILKCIWSFTCQMYYYYFLSHVIWKSIKTPTPTFVSQFCSAKFAHIRNASRNLSFVNLFGIFAPKWFSIFCILHQNYYWLSIFCILISSESLSHPFEVRWGKED